MTHLDRLADTLLGNLQMLQWHVSDFSDADLLVRPFPNANHANWQIGHMINAETRMVNGATPGTMPELPENILEKYKKSTSTIDDPKSFATKDELLAQFAKTRAATAAWVKALPDSDLDKPAPENIRAIAPTLGHMINLVPAHTAMHIGQIQVLRRKLNKPNLF